MLTLSFSKIFQASAAFSVLAIAGCGDGSDQKSSSDDGTYMPDVDDSGVDDSGGDDSGGDDSGGDDGGDEVELPEYGPDPEAECEDRVIQEIFVMDSINGPCTDCSADADFWIVAILHNPCPEPYMITVGTPHIINHMKVSHAEGLTPDLSTDLTISGFETIELAPGEWIDDVHPLNGIEPGGHTVEVQWAHDSSLSSYDFTISP